MEGSKKPANREGNKPRQKLTAFDHALIKAARDELPVTLEIGMNMKIQHCRIKTVDVYAVEIFEENQPGSVWYNKAFIVSAEIHSNEDAPA